LRGDSEMELGTYFDTLVGFIQAIALLTLILIFVFLAIEKEK